MFPTAAKATQAFTRWITLLAILAVALIAATPANARMIIGIQNDEAFKYHPAKELARARTIGAREVRIMVPYDSWYHGESGMYVQAASALHRAGFRVMATLFSWDNHPTPRQWAAYAADVGPRLAPYVNYWGVMNEPNQLHMSPIAGHCMIRTLKHTRLVRLVRFKRLKNSRGHYKRTLRLRKSNHGRWRLVAHFSRARHGHWHRVVRRVRLTHGGQRVCSVARAANAYRAVWNATAPVLRNADPSAKLVVGDLCPCFMNLEKFMSIFYGSRLTVRPDALGIHPYDHMSPRAHRRDGSWRAHDIEEAVRWAKAHRLSPMATEWALFPNQPSAWWKKDLSRFRKAGVKAAILYDVGGKFGWDTRLRPAALAAVSHWNRSSVKP